MMNQADVTAARKIMLQARQTAYEALFTAIKTGDDPGRKTAKKALADTQDEEEALNQIVGLITVIADMP